MKLAIKSKDTPVIASLAAKRIKELEANKVDISKDADFINNLPEDEFSSENRTTIRKYLDFRIKIIDAQIEHLKQIQQTFTLN